MFLGFSVPSGQLLVRAASSRGRGGRGAFWCFEAGAVEVQSLRFAGCEKTP